MSSTDKRIVVLEFDNAAFESGVAKSLNTLDKLEKSIANTENISKSLNKLNSLDLGSMSSAFDTVTNRLSNLGIIGATILQNLTNTAVDSAKKIVNSLTGAITQGGWNRASNIEHAKFQLEGLGVAWTDISEDIDYAVKDTAYGLDAAAVAASQLVASGVGFGQWSDDMKKALRGISGVAAMTNSSYEEIANIFTRVAGNGRVFAIDLNSIAARGINAAAALGNYFGYTESEIREMVSDGKINFQMFADAMDSTFGDHAKEANRTFDGALSNIRAALSRTGQAFIEPAMADRYYYEGELKNFVDVLNGFRVVINGVNTALSPLAEKVEEVMHVISESALNKLEWLYSKDYWTGEVTDHISEPISKAINTFLEFAHNMRIGLGNIGESIKKIGSGFRDAILSLFPNIKNVGDYVINFSESFRSKFAKSFSDFFSNAKNDTYNLVRSFRNIVDTFKYVFDIAKDALKNIFPNFFSTIRNGLQQLPSGLEKITKYLKSIFNGRWKEIQGVIYAITAPISILFKLLNGVGKILGAIGGSTIIPFLKGILDTIINIVSNIGHLIKPINDSLRGFDGFSNAATTIKKKLEPLKIAIRQFFDAINGGINTFFKWISVVRDVKKESNGFGSFISSITDMMKNKGGGFETFANIIERIKSIFEKIMPYFKNFGDGIKTTFTGLWESINSVFSKKKGEEVETVGDKIKNGLIRIDEGIEKSEKGNKIKAFFDRIGDALKSINWASIIDKIGIAFQTLKTILSAAWEGIKKAWGVVKPILEQVWQYMKQVWAGITGGESITTIAVKGGIFSVLVTFAQFITKLGKPLETLDSLKDKVGGILDSIQGVFVKYQETIKADVIKKIAIAIGIMAASVLVLSFIDSEKLVIAVGALGTLMALLSNLFRQISSSNMFGGKVAEKNVDGIKGIAGGLKDAFNSFKEGLSGGQIGLTLIEFAAAIHILVSSVKKLAKLNMTQLIQGVATIGALAAIMLVMLNAVAEFGRKSEKFGSDSVKIASSLVIFSVAISILSGSILVLSKINSEKLWTSVGIISMMVLALLALVSVLSKVDPSALRESEGAIILFAVSIGILALAAQLISKMSWPDLGKFGALLLGFAVSVVAFSHLVNADKLGSAKAALIIFAAAIAVLAGVVFVMSKTPWDGVQKFIVSTVAFSAALALFSRLVKPDGLVKAAGAAALFAGVMHIVSLVVRAFSGISWTDLAIAGAAIAGFALIMTGVTFALSKMKGFEKQLASFSKACISFGIAMLATGAGLFLFALAIERLAKSAQLIPNIVLTIVEGFASLGDRLYESLYKVLDIAFDVLIRIILNKVPTFSQTLLDLVMNALNMLYDNIAPIMDKVLDILIAVLSALEEKIPIIAKKVFNIISEIFKVAFDGISQNGVGNFAIIAGSLVAFGAALYFVGKNAEVYKKALIGLGVMLLAMTSIGAVLAVLSLINSDKLLKSAVSLSAAMVAFGVLTAILATIGEAGAGAIYGAVFGSAALGIVIAAVSAIVSAVYGIMQALEAITGGDIDFVGTINQVADVLGALGEAIGRFIGGIVAGFAMEALGGIGSALSEFMTNFQPFIEGAKNIDESTLRGVECLVAVLLALSVAELIDAFANNPLLTFGGGRSFSDLAADLVAFAHTITEFAATVSTLSEGDLAKTQMAADAAISMATFANAIPRSGGLLQKIIGEKDITEFGAKMIAFIESMNDSIAYLRESGISETDVTNFQMASDIGIAMSEFAKTIPRSGGILQDIIGEQDIGDFGTKLQKFIEAMNDALISLRDISISEEDVTRFKMASEIGLAMNDLAQAIPRTGGILQDIIGEKDIGDFGTKVKTYVDATDTALTSLRDISISEEDVTRFQLMAQAGRAMNDLAQAIPRTGGFIEKIVGEKDIGNFGEKIKTFATALAEVQSIMITGGLNERTLTIMAMAAGVAEILGSAMPSNSTFIDALFGTTEMQAWKDKLILFGSAIAGFSREVKGRVDLLSVTIAAIAGEILAALAKDIPDSTGILGWLFGGTKNFAEFGAQLVIFGGAIVEFSKTVAGKVDVTAVQVAALAGDIMATLAQNIPDSTGVLGWLFGGTKDFAEFGAQLVAFGAGLVLFSAEVNGKIDANAVKLAADCAAMVLALTDELPDNKGILGKIFGGQSFSEFGSELPDFGKGIAGFAKEISSTTIDPDQAEAAMTVASGIASIELPAGQSLWQKLFGGGTMSYDSFGKSLKNFAKGLVDFNNEAKGGGEFEAGEHAVTVAGRIITKVTELGENDGSMLKTLGKNLKDYGSSYKDFYYSIAETDNALINTAVAELYDIIDALIYIDEKQFEGASNFAKTLDEVSSTSIDDFCKAFEDASIDFSSILVSLAVSGVGALTSMQFRYKEAGRYNVAGYIEGMKSKNQDVYNAAYQLGKTALDATARATLTQSPSKEFSRLGMYNDVGYANGMLDNIQVIRNAGDKLGSESIAIMSKSVDKIMSMMDSDMDMQPVIRPVFDSSNIRSGISEVNRMYSGMAIGSGMSYTLSSNVQSGIRNTGDSQLVSAINDLKRTITSNPTNTYNVNGITYDDGSTVSNAISALIGAITVEGRM